MITNKGKTMDPGIIRIHLINLKLNKGCIKLGKKINLNKIKDCVAHLMAAMRAGKYPRTSEVSSLNINPRTPILSNPSRDLTISSDIFKTWPKVKIW